MLHCVVVCGSALQCVAVNFANLARRCVLQCIENRLQCIAVCGSVLQFVAVNISEAGSQVCVAVC